MSENYQKEIDRKNLEKINDMCKTFPYFIKDYIYSRRASTSTRTRLGYCYDMKRFLSWLKEEIPDLNDKEIKDITIEEFNQINTRDIEDYIGYLMSDDENSNGEMGVARKLASLGSLFSYLSKHELIEKNPCPNVEKPKIHETEIIVLTPAEISRLLSVIKDGSNYFSKKQNDYLEKTRKRDLAIVTLMLTTGIRVSECVGLNVDDLYLDECKAVIRRKGGNTSSVFLSDEAIETLEDYLEWRKLREKSTEDQETKEDSGKANKNKKKKSEKNVEKALFLSMQNKRICVQSIEDMVKKYSTAAGINKNITPHKFRKSFGTSLYNETGDIFLVAAALSHKSVTTTTKHYALQSKENLLNARNKVKINSDS